MKEVSSDNKAFTATKPNTTAGILETIEIPVTFESAEVGLHEGVITVETSAGTVTANVKALVRRMADFSSVVTEGSDLVTGFSTSEQYPFEVKDGVAYNANAGEADDVATESWFGSASQSLRGKPATSHGTALSTDIAPIRSIIGQATWDISNINILWIQVLSLSTPTPLTPAQIVLQTTISGKTNSFCVRAITS